MDNNQGSGGIFYQHKDKSDFFNFQILLGSLKDQVMINNFTGDPAIPLIGKYSRNSYHFLKVDLLVGIPFLLKNGKNFIHQGQIKLEKQTNYQFNMPPEVLDLLKNIPSQIPHNKPPLNNQQKKQSKKATKQSPYQVKQFEEEKINAQYLQKNESEYPPDEKIPFYHPLQFTFKNKIKFVWSIQSIKDFKILQPLKNDPCLSYVLHNMVFEEFNFQFQKRLVQYQPLSISKPYNVHEWLRDPSKSVSFEQIRSEYMSTHLSGGALCFSPNNMKFGFDLNKKIGSFWSVLLQENDEHLVCLHWIIMDLDLAKQFEKITKIAQNIYTLLTQLENIVDAPLIKEINTIFQ